MRRLRAYEVVAVMSWECAVLSVGSPVLFPVACCNKGQQIWR